MAEHPEEMTAMAQQAIAAHEVFQSLLSAGFTERQAISLVAQILLDPVRNDQS